MKKTLVLTLLVLAVSGIAQNSADKKQVKKMMKDAFYEYEGQDYYSAWRLYKRVLAIEPAHEEAAMNAVASMYKLNYPTDSAFFVAENLANNKRRGAKFYLARIKHQQLLFDEANTLLTNYARDKKKIHSDTEINYQLGLVKNAKENRAHPKQSIIKNMGTAINSPYPDYVPVIMPDESAIYFTSKRPNPSHPNKNGDNNSYEDVYVSYRENNTWKQAESLGIPVNSETNDGCVAISPDGQKMIVYRTAADFVSGDLYLTRMGKNNQWEPLQLMTSEINSPYIETSACFSNDTSEIFFSSDRPGGLGGKDLYRIRKLPNGKWSAPFNLGPNINTPYDEDAPFLHPDGVTLYFSSKGHTSMGEYDVFKSVYNNETNDFGISENLGYPINDVKDDIFFVLSVDGQRGYYSSGKQESKGEVDIYEIDTRFGENDLKVWQGVSYLGSNTGRVRITLMEKGSDKVNGYYLSNPDNGRFILVVNPMKAYTATVEADDFGQKEFEIKPMAFEQKIEKLNFTLTKNAAE